MSFNISSTQEVMYDLSQRFKQRRLLMRYTREGLGKRSDVSASSLKRFETTGHISLESLLKLSLVLECLEDFNHIAGQIKTELSLDSILKAKKIPKKGNIK